MEQEPAAAAVSSPPVEGEDIVMAEAGELQGTVEAAKPAAEPLSAQMDTDEDGIRVKQETKSEIKLEDLFDGIDSDEDELTSSNNAQQET
jgi:DNA primase small subunit